MSALRDTAERIARLGRFPTPNPDRKLESEKAADGIRQRITEGRDSGPAEPWDAFLVRIGLIDG